METGATGAGTIGSLRYLAVNDGSFPDYNYASLFTNPAQPTTSAFRTRSDVKVWWHPGANGNLGGAIGKGDLKVGYSQSRNPGWIGPEYGFGWAVADHFKQPVLLIKIAWGGKSLHTDFRPPGAVKARGGEVGPYYKAILDYTHDVLSNLGSEFPEWKRKGYRIAGIGWHQGWNDRVDAKASADYEKNLVDFIKDLRTEFGNPKLPFSITTTSMAPPKEVTAVELAQLAVGNPKKHPEFKGTVATTDVRPFWRDAAVSPSNFGYHWNHNGESTYLNGNAMGQGMLKILGQ